MKIIVNGMERVVESQKTIAEILSEFNVARHGIAVAVNEEIVPHTTHETHVLVEGDRVEIIRAIGGG
jgi:sulfur carrier protein